MLLPKVMILVSLAVTDAAALPDVGKGKPFRSAVGGGVDDTAGVCNADAGAAVALRFLEGADVAALDVDGVASFATVAATLLLPPVAVVAVEGVVASEIPLEVDSAVFFFAFDDISKSISWSSA